jgi:hypothetical protein
MKSSLQQKFLLAALGRFTLVATNLLLAVVIISVLRVLSALLMTPENDTREMIEMCNGTAIILYGYGVALKVRESFMKSINVYPACATPLRAWIDNLCHRYGIFFILLGLAQEVLVHIVIIPNVIVDTAGRESYVFAVCGIIQVFVLILLFLLSYRIIMAVRLAAQDGITADGVEATGNA